MEELGRKINECKVIESELISLQKGKAVYTQHGSGLVLYKSNPVEILHKNRERLKKLEDEKCHLQQQQQQQ